MTDVERDLISYLDFHVEAGVDAALDDTRTTASRRRTRRPGRPARTAGAARAEAAPPPRRDPAGGPALPRAHLRPIGRGQARRGGGRRARAGQGAAHARGARGAARRLSTAARSSSRAKNLVFADGNPASAPDVRRRGARRRRGPNRQALRGPLRPAPRPDDGGDRPRPLPPTSPTSCPGARPATATRRPRRSRSASPSSSARSSSPTPDILVCLGGPARELLGSRRHPRSRGRWYPYRTRREIRALATLHPAYLLRQPLQKRLAWRDFRRCARRSTDGPESV